MKILVVDDDRRIVRTTCDILKVKGHEPIAAHSGEDGVAMVRSNPPDCVLMDFKMTGINGVEAMMLMQQIIPALPVVLISAYVTDEIVDEAKRAGAYAVLSKPLNFPTILCFLSLLSKEESILVVDDDLNFSRTLKDILTMRGFKVQTENQPQRVLDHLEKDYKLAVVLDLKLGEVNGVEVLKKIQAKYPGKPVVLMTGYRQEMGDSIEKGRQVGAHTCLYKPFESDDLFQVLEEIRANKLQNVLAMA